MKESLKLGVHVFQLEVKMENCLNRDDPAGLVSVLQHEGLTSSTLGRLNQLVTRVRVCVCVCVMVFDKREDVLFQDLREPGFSRVLTVMKTLDLLSEDRADLQTLINHGLTAKVLDDPAEAPLRVSGFDAGLFRSCSGRRLCIT